MHQTSIECDRHGGKLDYWEENENKYDLDGGGGNRGKAKHKSQMWKEMCLSCCKNNKKTNKPPPPPKMQATSGSKVYSQGAEKENRDPWERTEKKGQAHEYSMYYYA